MGNNQGMLVVVSGPAGVGKGTLCRALFAQWSGLEYSVSVTTREPRPAEIEGKQYYFRSRDEFQKMIDQNELLEWADFCGNLYGTPKFHVENILAQKKTILLEIDIQGAKQVKSQLAHVVFIFIVPPTLEALSQRIHSRGTETEEIIQRRMARAVQEMDHMWDYDYVIENDHVDIAVEKLKSVIIAEQCRVKRNPFYLKEENK